MVTHSGPTEQFFANELDGFREKIERQLLPFRDKVDGAYVARLKAAG